MIEKHIENLIIENFPFKDFYDNQLEIIKKIVLAFLNKKKFFVLESPPGTGKSVIAYTAAKVINQLSNDEEGYPPSVALTKTIALQTQYSESFHDAATLWSAKRYQCEVDSTGETHYGSIFCKRTKCPSYDNCQYVNAKNEFFRNQSLGILNYAYFMVSSQVDPRILINDECHTLEEYLCDWYQFAIRMSTIERIINELELVGRMPADLAIALRRNTLNIINSKESKNIYAYLKDFQTAILRTHIALSQHMASLIKDWERTQDPSYKAAMKKYGDRLNQVSKLVERCNGLTDSDITWVISEQEKDEFIMCKPLSVAKYARGFFNRAKFVILMSGTICGIEEYCASLGIKHNEYEFLSLDSVVPTENRPIYSVGLVGLNYKNKEQRLPEYLSYIDGILDQFPTNRGIIHSVSYDNAEYIRNNTRHKDRIYIPSTDEVKDVAKLMRASKNMIICSPAILEGIDLPGELCEVQMFLKVPYPYLGDQWVSTKMELSRDWYLRQAVIKIVQGAGRGVRSKTDSAATFVLDSNFNKLVRNKHLFPSWFLDAVQTLEEA